MLPLIQSCDNAAWIEHNDWKITRVTNEIIVLIADFGEWIIISERYIFNFKDLYSRYIKIPVLACKWNHMLKRRFPRSIKFLETGGALEKINWYYKRFRERSRSYSVSFSIRARSFAYLPGDAIRRSRPMKALSRGLTPAWSGALKEIGECRSDSHDQRVDPLQTRHITKRASMQTTQPKGTRGKNKTREQKKERERASRSSCRVSRLYAESSRFHPAGLAISFHLSPPHYPSLSPSLVGSHINILKIFFVASRRKGGSRNTRLCTQIFCTRMYAPQFCRWKFNANKGSFTSRRSAVKCAWKCILFLFLSLSSLVLFLARKSDEKRNIVSWKALRFLFPC